MPSPSNPDLLQRDLLKIEVDALRVALAQLTDAFVLVADPVDMRGRDLTKLAARSLWPASFDPTAARCALLLEARMGRAGGDCGASFDTEPEVTRARIRCRHSFAKSLVGDHRRTGRALRQMAKAGVQP